MRVRVYINNERKLSAVPIRPVQALSFRICFIIPRELPSPMNQSFSLTAMPSKKCYHSSSESWHMICRRNPLIPRMAPWYFSIIIVPNYRLLSTDISPVSSLRLIHSALWVLASGFNLSRSSSFICICRHITHHHWTISPVQGKAVVACRPQFTRLWITAQSLCLSASRSCTFSQREGFLLSVPRDTH